MIHKPLLQNHIRGEKTNWYTGVLKNWQEQMPFQRFGMNSAYYFQLGITHFLFEAYKRDVAKDIIHAKAYPNTFTRLLIDFAAKFTSQARYTIMKVTQPIYDELKIDMLWINCQSPPEIQIF